MTVKTTSVAQNAPVTAVAPKQEEAVETEVLPKGASLASLEVVPKEIRLSNRFAYVQLLVTGKLASGETIDVTRMVEPSAVVGDRRGLALGSGAAQGRRQGDACSLRLAGQSVDVPVTVLGLNTPVRGRLRP